MIAHIAAVALAALPARLAIHPAGGADAPFAQEDREDAAGPYEDEEEYKPRLRFGAWGGEALASGGSGRSSGFVGGEAAWSFDSLDLGIAASGYRNLVDATRTWTPVVLARLTQRFNTRRGFEAAFGFGAGAGRRRGWSPWYQVALGLRVPLGPLFLAGELAFEQYDLLRLAAGLGVAF